MDAAKNLLEEALKMTSFDKYITPLGVAILD